MKALVIRSERRFDRFLQELTSVGVDTLTLDLSEPDWVDYDFSSFDIILFYPQFRFSSSSPFSLWEVKDCLRHIASSCRPGTASILTRYSSISTTTNSSSISFCAPEAFQSPIRWH